MGNRKIISEYSIFRPDSKRRIQQDYPEIVSKPVFKNLSPDELIFVWYFSCEASPYFDIDAERERTEKCLKAAFPRKGGGYSIPKNVVQDYLSGKFPLKIKEANAEMIKYRIGPRVRGLQMLEKGISKIEAILDIDPNDETQFLNKDGSVDFSKKKAYVDTFRSAMDSMPNLIEQMEQRFSVVEVKNEESIEGEGRGFIDGLTDNEQ
jgi:hypothetical protein